MSKHTCVSNGDGVCEVCKDLENNPPREPSKKSRPFDRQHSMYNPQQRIAFNPITTVGELIKRLQEYPPDSQVWIRWAQSVGGFPETHLDRIISVKSRRQRRKNKDVVETDITAAYGM